MMRPHTILGSPPTLLDMRAGIDPAGNVEAWESELFVPDGAAGLVPLTGADLAGLDSLGKLNPGGVLNDLAIPYVIPNVTTTAHRAAIDASPTSHLDPLARAPAEYLCQRVLSGRDRGRDRRRSA
jgi:hypothetical protein